MLILASASKARHLLLKKARIPHKIIKSNFNEDLIQCNNPKELSILLSQEKAKNVESKVLFKESKWIGIEPISAILGCDSIFEFRGEIFGKPKNKDEAIERLQMISARSGFLHTGHTLLIRENKNKNNPLLGGIFKTIKSCVITTYLEFCAINIKEIKSYVDSGEPLHCAGSFTLEGEGAKFIKSINGCYSNVIGLSLPWLREELTIHKLN